MREAAETWRPIWRTRLAVALVAWMALVVTVTLGAWRLTEVLPPEGELAFILGVYIVPAVTLLVWGVWAMLRDPVTGWLAPTILLAFLGSMVPAFGPLTDAAVRLNFLDHRPAYEAIVAEIKAGRLSGSPASGGWREGVRDGVRFRHHPDRPSVVEFVWNAGGLGEAGVLYDEKPCKPSPVLKCVGRGEPLGGHYFFYGVSF